MRTLIGFLGATLAACGAQPASEDSAARPEPMTYTLHCQESWSDCYTQARNRCGHGDFDELDRHASASIGVDTHVGVPTISGRERATVDMVDRTITIRCNSKQ